MYYFIMKITILSPHIDDAGYSLAIVISRLIDSKIPVSVVNCFTITNWAIRAGSKNINEITFLRKQEDIEFYKSFHAPAEIVNLDLLDAPLRNGFIFQEKPFGSKDLKVVETLRNYIEKVQEGILFCPLAIGNHIDHAICREALLGLDHKRKILFYEDLPYANRITETQLFQHIKMLEERLKLSLGSHVVRLSNSTFDKEEAIRKYKTQINDQFCWEIISRMNALHGERIWGPVPLLEEFLGLIKS